MRLIARRSTRAYIAKNPDSRSSLERWVSVVEQAHWASMSEAANAFSKAKSLSGTRVRYDLGQGYRLIAAFNFNAQICFVKFMGTHAEYDKIDAATVSQF